MPCEKFKLLFLVLAICVFSISSQAGGFDFSLGFNPADHFGFVGFGDSKFYLNDHYFLYTDIDQIKNALLKIPTQYLCTKPQRIQRVRVDKATYIIKDGKTACAAGNITRTNDQFVIDDTIPETAMHLKTFETKNAKYLSITIVYRTFSIDTFKEITYNTPGINDDRVGGLFRTLIYRQNKDKIWEEIMEQMSFASSSYAEEMNDVLAEGKADLITTKSCGGQGEAFDCSYHLYRIYPPVGPESEDDRNLLRILPIPYGGTCTAMDKEIAQQNLVPVVAPANHVVGNAWLDLKAMELHRAFMKPGDQGPAGEDILSYEAIIKVKIVNDVLEAENYRLAPISFDSKK
jgi:hypothetical protein